MRTITRAPTRALCDGGSKTLKRGTPDHPKVAHLATLLNIRRSWAVGILEMLWHFTAKYAPQGDIGRYDDATIARAVDWDVRSGSAGVPTEVRLRSALVQAGFLDTCPKHRLIVHDWRDHADQAVTKFLSRHSLDFVRTEDSLPLPLPEPLPLPVPPASAVRASGGSSPKPQRRRSTGVQERASPGDPAMERLSSILGEEPARAKPVLKVSKPLSEDERAAAIGRVAAGLRASGLAEDEVQRQIAMLEAK